MITSSKTSFSKVTQICVEKGRAHWWFLEEEAEEDLLSGAIGKLCVTSLWLIFRIWR